MKPLPAWRSDETFERHVTAACAHAIPLGAYAGAGGAHYLFLDSGGVSAVSRALDGSPDLPSFSGEFPLFSWDEREMHDEFAVRFRNLPDARALRAIDGRMPPAVVANGTGVMHAVVGPVHAGIIEPGRFTFSSGGETVVHLDAQLGYAHRGVERRLSGMLAAAAPPFIARICGGCSAARSWAYALALEQLAGTTIDRASELARLVAAELERIYNHLADVAAAASAAGWGPGFARGMALKERAMRLCRSASGHRLLFDAIVPGGVGPLTLREPERVRAELESLRPAVESYLATLFANVSVVSRWNRCGTVPADVARACGAVGPAHRATGDGLDVRAFAPYGAYRSVGVQVAHAPGGDAFARCAVKRDELRESFRLADLALAELGTAVPAQAPSFEVPAGFAAGVVEGPRGTETVAVHTAGAGVLERVHVISASYRNWPIVARAMDGNIVPDFPLVNKSFNLCYACADR